MKTIQLFIIVLFAAIAVQAQPQPPVPPPRPLRSLAESPATPVKEPVNYVIRVEWKAAKEDPRFLEVLTTEGSFSLNTVQKNPVKINDMDVPVTLKFSGSLSTLNDEKGRLQLFLGRTIPYVTSKSGTGPSAPVSYSQMSVGLDSTFVVKFGKSQVVQSDENGEITVLVTRADK